MSWEEFSAHEDPAIEYSLRKLAPPRLAVAVLHPEMCLGKVLA